MSRVLLSLCLAGALAGCPGDDEVPEIDAGGADASAEDATTGTDGGEPDACAACPAPPDGCTYTDGCRCTGLVCADAGADDAGSDDAGSEDASPEQDAGPDACVPPPCPAPPEGCHYETSDPCVCGELVCPEGCTSDDECAPDGWCRALEGDGAGRACHPWAGEEERCGGFTPPWAAERCHPELGCVSHPLIADAPGQCALRVTLEELLANPESYVDRFVAVSGGEVAVGLARCTRIACPDEMPCCNTCSGNQVYLNRAGMVPMVMGGGDPYSCTGSECEWTDCDAELGAPFLVLGRFDGTALVVSAIYPGS